MDKTEFTFSGENLEKEMQSFAQRKITELYVHDKKIASDKKTLIHFLNSAIKEIPDVFINLKVNANLIDNEIISLLSQLFCSLEIPMTNNDRRNSKEKNVYLLDKKLFSKKAALLNDGGFVFGFDLDFALSAGDCFKMFRDRLDFAMTLYPNHIDFPQLEKGFPFKEICTGTYSSQEIDYSKKLAVSAKIFYTKGRAVPWFNVVLNALKFSPSKFFSDFSEWLSCNNVPLNDIEKAESLTQKEIEKMQLLFLEMKFEEKQKEHLYVIVKDVVSLYGAFSRIDFENEETVLFLSFNPDDLLSPAVLNLSNFADSVCMQECKVKVFAGEDSPDYKIIE